MKQDPGTKKIEVQGNRPLLMSNYGAWLIVKGQLDIFTVPFEGEEWGKREYLFTATQGTVMLGGSQSSELLSGTDQSVDPAQYAFLASSNTKSLVIELSPAELTKAIENKTTEILHGLTQWFVLGDKSILEGLKAKFEALLQEATPAKEVCQGLNALNGEMLSQALRDRLTKVAAFRERCIIRSQTNQLKMRQAFQKMMATIVREGSITAAEYDTPLFRACSLVAASRKIDIKAPAQLVKDGTAAVTLDDITKASNFNIREVILESNWWKKDIGSLLGFMQEDGRPVAIIATRPQTYLVYDVAKGRKFKVTGKTARLINPKAVMFYRPFPNKILQIKDLAVFGHESIWKQDIMIFVLIGLVGSVFGMATPKVTELLFNKIIPEGSMSQLVQIASLYFVVLASKILLDTTRSFATKRMEGHLESSMQAAVMDRLVKLPVPFFKQYTTGDLTSRVNAISTIRSILSGAVINAIITGVFGLVYLVMLFMYSMKLAVVALVMVAVIVLVNYLVSIINLKYAKEQQKVDNKIHGLVYELVTGVSKFRSAGAEERAFHRWALPFSKGAAINIKSGYLVNGVEVVNTAANIIFSMIFYYMIVVKKVGIPLGQFVAFQSAFAIFSTSILGLMKTIIDSNRVLPLYELAKPILETLPEYDAEKPDPGVIKGAIELKHINFRYNPDGPLILKDVSLTIQEGEYVGIVGSSGSGKSTLLRILLGFEKPEDGQVYYDGKDLSTIDVKALRRQFGVVLQNAHVMAGSIYNNIVGSHYHLTLKDAEEAAAMAGLSGDIEQMPMGMHTMVPDGGSTLSGGQRQRLVIARALVNKPKILFFDEATSALDNRTQEIVSQSLKRLKATRIVIAHRLSTIVECDRIIVFKDGRIVEEGTYRELMDKAGLFAELAKRQLA
ncbi:MAG: NHLP bacteriocin export ABC transporter permease/ATPase subunit [Bacteroidota bacterium]